MSIPFTLRPYQSDAVDATLRHFRQSDEPAVIVLPTGAGKSLVIAELARLARRKILVLAHVKELVEQNHAKYQSYGLTGGIFAAGLQRKETQQQVTFASVQSVAANLDAFQDQYSLLIVDECHRISDDENSQYGKIITQLQTSNPSLKVLGLTATPYRMGTGWIYRYHHRGYVRSPEDKTFTHCIYELPLSYMIKQGFLTEPKLVDACIAHYDFSSLIPSTTGEYPRKELNTLLGNYPRVTQAIIEQVIELSESRKAVMIFAATIEHAQEIYGYLPAAQSALITGTTTLQERDQLIQRFKQQELKFLVNVSVLTTGFDAPHVDVIAILRPTASVSLYQQIVGRGLRLAEGKTDCLVIDYAGNNFNLHHPEVGEAKPDPDSEPVQVFCPACDFANTFWGKTNEQGEVIEHHGRRCQGLVDSEASTQQQCTYRFRFKSCPHCNAENDIAARKCQQCQEAIIDPDDQLKAALKLKDAMVLRCSGITLSGENSLLYITYHGEGGEELKERFDLSKRAQLTVFNHEFSRRCAAGQTPLSVSTVDEALQLQNLLPTPDFVIARKKKYYWQVQSKIFDYQGPIRKANQL